MRIAFAGAEDLDYLVGEDRHVPPSVLEQKVGRREILVLWHDDHRAGALRYGHFWDEIPFMNMLWVREGLRSRGFGTRLIARWENEIRELGHERVMTSTLSSERAAPLPQARLQGLRLLAHARRTAGDPVLEDAA